MPSLHHTVSANTAARTFLPLRQRHHPVHVFSLFFVICRIARSTRDDDGPALEPVHPFISPLLLPPHFQSRGRGVRNCNLTVRKKSIRSSRPGQICVFECAHLAYYEERCRSLQICSIVRLHSRPCTFPRYNSVPTNGKKMCGPLIAALSSLRPTSNL